MDQNNLSFKKFVHIFKNSLRSIPKTYAIKTLFNERNISRIKHDPYYQRNYVWDEEKRTFFIESILLGTDIPPLILFRSGTVYELIDGRQRFETIKRFLGNEFALSSNGLKQMQAYAKKTFAALPSDVQDQFRESCLRIFQFEIFNEPEISIELEDEIKKEIFRRYNSGITPLSNAEVDNAIYNDDILTKIIKEDVKNDSDFRDDLIQVFFSDERKNVEDANITELLRRQLALPYVPIKSYASANARDKIMDLFYEYFTNEIQGEESEVYNSLKGDIKQVIGFYKNFKNSIPGKSKRFIAECLLWGIRILRLEDIEIDINSSLCVEEILRCINNDHDIFIVDSQHYAKYIVQRYTVTSKLFEKLTKANLSNYIIATVTYHQKYEGIKQQESDAKLKATQYENLRLVKSDPKSTPIEEILEDLRNHRYILRPSYQREEKISVQKASAIIESILLGIKLPPIFIFKKIDKTYEVLDGQQRLLSILAFRGTEYVDINGKNCIPKISRFKLRKLNILDRMEGKSYADLLEEEKNTILDFNLDIITIDQNLNQEFEPIDFFVRLNYKPYPISPNSFEMWNSIVNREVIQKIRDITSKHSDWFYLKKQPERDRMLNQELITILAIASSFLNSGKEIDHIFTFVARINSVTCRIKDKSSLTQYLVGLDSINSEKDRFLNVLKNLDCKLDLLKEFLQGQDRAEYLDKVFNYKNHPRYFRRSQEFYIFWLLFDSVSLDKINNFCDNHMKIVTDVLKILKPSTEESEFDSDKRASYILDKIKQMRMNLK